MSWPACPSPIAARTLYRWDGAAGAIRYDYYSSDGAHSGGLARPDGTAIRFSEEVDGGAHGRRDHRPQLLDSRG